jgi:hypothetical protein
MGSFVLGAIVREDLVRNTFAGDNVAVGEADDDQQQG